MLEKVHANVMHLGKLADIQTLKHGLPPSSTNTRNASGLSPGDELLQTFAMNLFSYHMVPPSQIGVEPQQPPAQAATPVDVDPAVKPTLPRRHPKKKCEIPGNQAGGSGAARTSDASGSVDGDADGDVEVALTVLGSAAADAAAADGDSTDAADGSAAGGAGPSNDSAAGTVAERSSAAAGDAGAGGSSGSVAGASAVRWHKPNVQVAGTKAVNARAKWSIEEVAKFEEGIALYGENAPACLHAIEVHGRIGAFRLAPTNATDTIVVIIVVAASRFVVGDAGESKPMQIAQHIGTRTNEQVRERVKMVKRRMGLLVKFRPPTQRDLKANGVLLAAAEQDAAASAAAGVHGSGASADGDAEMDV